MPSVRWHGQPDEGEKEEEEEKRERVHGPRRRFVLIEVWAPNGRFDKLQSTPALVDRSSPFCN